MCPLCWEYSKRINSLIEMNEKYTWEAQELLKCFFIYLFIYLHAYNVPQRWVTTQKSCNSKLFWRCL